MSKESSEQFKLRAYLLGRCGGQEEQENIEEKLMVNEKYFQQLLLQEELLIEDYVDEELNAAERKAFENHFLIPVERREKVKLAHLLRNHLNEDEKIFVNAKEYGLKKKITDLRRFFSSPITVGVSILLILGFSALFWNIYSPGSDARDKALISLNKAYSLERPFESRISEFEYAPFDRTRAQEVSKINSVEQDRAERISLDEVSEKPTAENQHLLARVYLAKKDFDKALTQFEEAQKKLPQDPEILNDIGTTYLEKSRLVNDDAEKITLVASAVENFDKALAINPNLLSARFNKAIATEIYLPNRGKEAWQEYLNLDQTSRWADEARKHLDNLNKQETQNIPTADKLESAFLAAYEEQNDEEAFRVVSQNREIISGKYLPQRFAMALVNKKKTNEIRKSRS